MRTKEKIELELMEEVLKKGNNLRFRALGSSMFPVVRSGDIITVKPIKALDLNVGDIIFFKNNGKYFAHRIIRKEKIENVYQFITRGDFLPDSDPVIEESQIHGKVVKVDRGGHIIRLDTYRMQKIGSLIIVINPILYPFLELSLKSLKKVRMIFSKLNSILNGISLVRRFKRSLVSSVNYKIVKRDDIKAVSVYYSTTEAQVLQSIKEGSFYCMAKHKKKIVGALIVGKAWQKTFNDNNWWIMSLDVKNRFQGAGIGSKLILEAIKEMEKRGIEEVFLNLFENNIPAINLYKKMGFKSIPLPETEDKINKHYEKVAPGSQKCLILHFRI